VFQGETGAPKTGGVAAILSNSGEGGRVVVEDDTIPMFPQVPKAKEPKHGGRARVDRGEQAARGGVGNAHGSAGGAAQHTPKGDREGALEKDVNGGLQGSRANGTPAPSLVDDAFLEKVGVTLGAALKQDPGEEAHFGRDAAAPDEVEAAGANTAVRAKTVEGRDHEPALGISAERENTSVCPCAQLDGGEPGGHAGTRPQERAEERGHRLDHRG
jgi:hypothetical protein